MRPEGGQKPRSPSRVAESSQSSSLGEWGTKHSDGAFPDGAIFFFDEQDDKKSRVRSQQTTIKVDSNPRSKPPTELGVTVSKDKKRIEK